MMIENRKEEGRVCTVLLHVVRKSPMPSENRLTANLFRKSLSPLGFKLVLLRQNADDRPLMPPPLLTNYVTLPRRLLIPFLLLSLTPRKKERLYFAGFELSCILRKPVLHPLSHGLPRAVQIYIIFFCLLYQLATN